MCIRDRSHTKQYNPRNRYNNCNQQQNTTPGIIATTIALPNARCCQPFHPVPWWFFIRQLETKSVYAIHASTYRKLHGIWGRVIPYYGLCLDRKCSPQFERCFHCDLFIPDPQYREYIAAAIKRLQEANELIARKHGNDTIRQQNLKDIQTFNAYLEKMDATKKHQKES